MRETDFRRFLTGRLGGRSIDGYVACCRRVEGELAVDLDLCDLGPDGIRGLVERLRWAGIAEKSVGNCGSAMRAYAALVRAGSAPVCTIAEGPMVEVPGRHGDGRDWSPEGDADTDTHISMAQATVRQLLTTYGEVMAELRRRGVVRTGNAPVGDYAELLFSKAFGWTLEGNSAAGYDAVDADGLRYQIKGRRLAGERVSRQLSAIRRIDDRAFDHLAAVLFDPGFGIRRAAVVPYALVRVRARRSEHTNSWIYHLDDRVWAEEGVRDVTDALAVAAARL